MACWPDQPIWLVALGALVMPFCGVVLFEIATWVPPVYKHINWFKIL